MTILSDSTQRARKEHLCDYCGEYILPGQMYSRYVWVPGRGTIHVIKEHLRPSCPDNEFDMAPPEPVEFGVPMALALVTKQVVMIARNGETVVENKTVLETVVGEAILFSDDYVEVPF